MKRSIQLLILALFFLAAAGCQSVSLPGVSSQQPEAPKPEAGQATIAGRVLTRGSKTPVTNTPVRLAEVVRQGNEGAFVLDGAFSPGDITDENGYFVIENVEAREYVIVVGDVMGIYEVIPDPDGRAKVWNALADQVLSTGDLEVDLTR